VAETVGTLRDLAEAASAAKQAAYQAFKATDRFYPPDTPWNFPRPVPTSLYYWYDADGRLLYVGITGNLAARQDSHAKRSSWAEFAASSVIERYPSREAAEAAEKDAIESSRPLFNRIYNDTPEARERLVAYLVERGRTDLLVPAVSRG
jgi:hypothetical protein